jgi:hypothetical protein
MDMFSLFVYVLFDLYGQLCIEEKRLSQMLDS